MSQDHSEKEGMLKSSCQSTTTTIHAMSGTSGLTHSVEPFHDDLEDFDIVTTTTQSANLHTHHTSLYPYHHGHYSNNHHNVEFSCLEKIIYYCIGQCDLWKVIPTTMVSTAFSLSITVLTSCSIISIQLLQPQDDNGAATKTTPSKTLPILFGLWTFTENGTFDTSSSSSHSNPQCRSYDFTSNIIPSSSTTTTTPSHNDSSSSYILLDDISFQMARAFGLSVVCIGFLAMASLWMGVMRDYYESTTHWRKWVGASLWLCTILQFMALYFMLYQINMCQQQNEKNQINNNHHNDDMYHDSQYVCHLGPGANWAILATLSWFLSGMILFFWPRINKRDYVHSSVAADEDEEDNYEYPAETAIDYYENGLWDGIWKSLGSEELEMTPYRDNPQQDDNHDHDSNNNNSTNDRPYEPSSSLRDLMSSFDSELNVSFEPVNSSSRLSMPTTQPMPQKQQQQQQYQPSRSTAEHALPSSNNSSNNNKHNSVSHASALERLRQQSTIQPSKSPPPSTKPIQSPTIKKASPPHTTRNTKHKTLLSIQQQEVVSRSSLKYLLDDAFEQTNTFRKTTK